MPFAEDISPYFADFGLVANYGDLQTLVILDEPDREILNGRVTSTEYSMTYPTAAFKALAHGDQVSITRADGTRADEYNVIAVNKQSDGTISIATLARVASS